MACYLNSYMYSFFSGSVCSQRAKRFFCSFKQLFKFFWVFPPVSPSRNWIMYLRSELPRARHRLAVMWPVCLITWPCGLCHLSWMDFWCCSSTLCDQGLLIEKCRTTCSRSTNHEWASDHLSEIIFRLYLSEPQRQRCEGFRDAGQCWSMNKWQTMAATFTTLIHPSSTQISSFSCLRILILTHGFLFHSGISH